MLKQYPTDRRATASPEAWIKNALPLPPLSPSLGRCDHRFEGTTPSRAIPLTSYGRDQLSFDALAHREDPAVRELAEALKDLEPEEISAALDRALEENPNCASSMARQIN